MPKIIGFNYDCVNDQTARRAKAHADQIHELNQRTGESVVEIGRRLTEVRELLGENFRAWLDGEFRWSQSFACVYMQAFERFAGVDCLRHFQPFGITTLSRGNAPEKAVAAAIKLAKSGEIITGKVARELIREHGGQPVRKDAGQARSAPPTDAGENVVTSLKRTLQTFSHSLQQLPLTAEDRDRLADELLQLAVQLRQLKVKPALSKASKRRKAS